MINLECSLYQGAEAGRPRIFWRRRRVAGPRAQARPALSRAKAAIASMVARPVLAMAAGQVAMAEQTGS